MLRAGLSTAIALVWGFSFATLVAAPANRPVRSMAQAVSYVPPSVLTADIYSEDMTNGAPVFKFKRTATREGSTMHVICEYSASDGKLAAREQVDYRDHALLRYESQELQTGSAGTASIDRTPSGGHPGVISFHYTKDTVRHGLSATRTEPLAPDTLVGDMVGPFLADHWDKLAHGEKVTCRLIVVSRRETVGFTFRKSTESRWHGHDVLVLKMEPSSFLLSAIVDPLYFSLETNPPHRVLQYRGRTIPKVNKAGHWLDLDAVTIFNW